MSDVLVAAVRAKEARIESTLSVSAKQVLVRMRKGMSLTVKVSLTPKPQPMSGRIDGVSYSYSTIAGLVTRKLITLGVHDSAGMAEAHLTSLGLGVAAAVDTEALPEMKRKKMWEIRVGDVRPVVVVRQTVGYFETHDGRRLPFERVSESRSTALSIADSLAAEKAKNSSKGVANG